MQTVNIAELKSNLSAFLEQVRKAPHKWLVLDAALTPEQLLQQLKSHIGNLQWLKV